MIELDAASVTVPTGDGTATILQPTTLQLVERRISIIGANGSGKSTLARLLNGLIVPTTGSVRIGETNKAHRNRREGNGAESGADTASFSTTATSTGAEGDDTGVRWFDTAKQGAEVRRRVGFVFTDPSAQLVMPTALEDVALSLRRIHAKKEDRLSAAHHALERFGLEALADRSVHALSGGQRQLLALAAVLATDPAILVADEPTTLLDLSNSLRIRELLENLPQQTIVVTHDLELAAQAQRTLVVDGARVVFDGEPEHAVAHYRGLVQAARKQP